MAGVRVCDTRLRVDQTNCTGRCPETYVTQKSILYELSRGSHLSWGPLTTLSGLYLSDRRRGRLVSVLHAPLDVPLDSVLSILDRLEQAHPDEAFL
jgi:hypothetical protein